MVNIENINTKRLYLSFKSDKYVNFGTDKNKIQFKLRLDYFFSNAKDIDDLIFLSNIIQLVEHYTISSVIDYYMKYENRQLIKTNSILIKKKEDGQLAHKSSNFRIINEISQNIQDSHDLFTKEANFNSQNVLFIDDFIGTGATCINEFSKFNKNCVKEALVYYITEEGILNLETQGIKVHYYKKINSLDKKAIDRFYQMHHFDNENYFMNLLLSESFISPNNNIPHIYKSDDKWKGFLTRNDEFRTVDNRLDNFIKTYGIYITETDKDIQRTLYYFGYTNKESRQKLLKDYLNENDDSVCIEVSELIENKISALVLTIKEPNPLEHSRRK